MAIDARCTDASAAIDVPFQLGWSLYQEIYTQLESQNGAESPRNAEVTPVQGERRSCADYASQSRIRGFGIQDARPQARLEDLLPPPTTTPTLLAQRRTQLVSTPMLLAPGRTELVNARPSENTHGRTWASSSQPRRVARFPFDFKVVFSGYDHEIHAAFELVPRLIGKGGRNMIPFPRMGAAARVCGRGSGYLEVQTADGQQCERDDALQLAVACRTPEIREQSLKWAASLLGELRHHFRRFCRKNGLPCPELYYLSCQDDLGTSKIQLP